MTEQNSSQAPPQIVFPCENYPIKIVGHNRPEFRDVSLEVVEIHAPGFDAERISFRDSRNGKFISMTVFITATGKEQLETLHKALKDTGHVVTVL